MLMCLEAEAVEPPGIGVAGSCEPLNVAVRN